MLNDEKAKIIENFMDELCRRYKDAVNNDLPNKFSVTSIFKKHLMGFDRHLINKVLEEFSRKDGLISIEKDIVRLTKDGKHHCIDIEI